jgi:hypothetical protein
MIYIIISNIGLAIMMIYIYFRYSHFRIASSNEIKALREKNDKQTLELREFDAKLLSSIKGYQDKVEALLIELGKVRAEKEKEIELKNSVEKKYEILKQKNADYELIHSEISTAIMSIVNDTHETAKNLERDIFNKIDNTAKKELEENQKLISKINQNVVDFVTKFNSTQNKLIRDKEDIKFYELFQNINGEIANNLINDAVSLIRNKGLIANEHFVTQSQFEGDKAKLMLCEIAVIKNDQLLVLDFKSTNYIFEYYLAKAKNDKLADENLAIKFRRYLMLLSNNKYYEIINQLLQSFGFNFKNHKIKIIVPSKSEINLLKDLQFYNKAQELSIDILDIEELNKIL